MTIVDLLIMIIVVTILVTLALGVVTYLAFKLRRARKPVPEVSPGDGSWYFFRYVPDAPLEIELRSRDDRQSRTCQGGRRTRP